MCQPGGRGLACSSGCLPVPLGWKAPGRGVPPGPASPRLQATGPRSNPPRWPCLRERAEPPSPRRAFCRRETPPSRALPPLAFASLAAQGQTFDRGLPRARPGTCGEDGTESNLTEPRWPSARPSSPGGWLLYRGMTSVLILAGFVVLRPRRDGGKGDGASAQPLAYMDGPATTRYRGRCPRWPREGWGAAVPGAAGVRAGCARAH
jgi:hypothetical protein